MKVIGFAGKKGAGKDTAAEFMFPDAPKVGFADPLKAMLSVLLPLEYLNDPELKEKRSVVYGCTPRHMMQTLGTEWGRKMVHPDIWTLQMHRELVRLDSEPLRVVVVTDIRFDNEAGFLKDVWDATIFEVVREGSAQDTHASEVGVNKAFVDRTLINNGTLKEFEIMCKVLGENMMKEMK